MSDHKKIIWLASYPKSGNTWFRVFLTNLINKNNEPADINKLITSSIASSRQLFDEATGLSSSDLSFKEINNLRPEVYRHIARHYSEVVFHKIHDAFHISTSGRQMIPEDITKGVIYFIRNPLDIVISFAHHSNTSIDKMINIIADDNFAFCNNTKRLHNQLPQNLMSWSNHVKSWVEKSGLPIHIIKYEDMKMNSFDTFSRAVRFLQLEYSEVEIRRAIELSDIRILQEQERDHGFKEKSIFAEFFFRKGQAGDWKGVLTNKQISQITSDHYEVMKKYGYLDVIDKKDFIN